MDDKEDPLDSPLLVHNGNMDYSQTEEQPPPQRPKKSALKRAYKKASDMGLIRVAVWILLTVIMSIAGAWIYRFIESDIDYQNRITEFENATSRLAHRNESLDDLIQKFIRLNQNGQPQQENEKERLYSKPWWNRTILAKRAEILRLIEDYEQNVGIDVSPPKIDKPGWTFQNAMFFCCSLYNSIGFGNRLFPETQSGQVVTMIYSFIGIPFMLAMTSDLGLVVFDSVYWFWWSTKEVMKMRPGAMEEYQRKKAAAANIELFKKEESTFPVSGGIVMSVLSLAFCSGVVMLIEPNWTYFDANYYYVTSFLTIGLGDISPSAPKNGPEWTLLPHTILLIFCMTFIGLFQHVLNRRIELVYAHIENAIHMEFRDKEDDPDKGADKAAAPMDEDDMDAATDAQIARLAGRLGFFNRFYYAAMDQSRSRLLQEIWVRKANMKNMTNQTKGPKRDVGCQHLNPVDDEFDISTYGDYIGPEYAPKKKEVEDLKLVKYVYNVD